MESLTFVQQVGVWLIIGSSLAYVGLSIWDSKLVRKLTTSKKEWKK